MNRVVQGIVLTAITLLSFTPTLSAAGVLHVSTDESHVVVRGAQSGATVLLIGFQRTFVGYEPLFRRMERSITADPAGQAELVLDKPLKDDFFWVAVDLATGAVGSGIPPGRRGRGGELPAAALVRGAKGIRAVQADADYAFVVVVRPGLGVWQGTCGDGAASDSDGLANGRLQINAVGLVARRGKEQLNELIDGDVVLVFPAHRMTYLKAVVK